MADLVISAVHMVKGGDEHQITLPAGVAITAGQAITPDGASGKWVLSNATAAGTIGDVHIALNSAAVGESVTGVKLPCILDVGEALAGLNFAAVVYLSDTDGALADAAGTVSTPVGRVVPGWANISPDKLLRVTVA